MKKFSIQQFMFFLFLAIFIYWDVSIVVNLTSYIHKKKQYKNLCYEYIHNKNQLYRIANKKIIKNKYNFQSICNSISDKDNSFLENQISELNSFKTSLYKKFRIRYTNSEIISFLVQAVSKNIKYLQLKDIRPSILKKKTIKIINELKWEKILVEVKFRARYHEAASVLNTFEKSKYLYETKIYSIKRGKKDPKGPLFVTIRGYFYRVF